MGGGEDSRTPRALNELLPECPTVIRNYSFDPETAVREIEAWVEELKPCLIISESMGANYGILVGKGIAHIYLSPAFGAPVWIANLCWFSLIPGVPALLSRIFRPRPGKRQALDFHFRPAYHFVALRRRVRAALKEGDNMSQAWFGSKDGYRRWGVVNIRRWQRFLGKKCCHIDDNSHFWEKERVTGSGLLDEIRRLTEPYITSDKRP